MKTFIATSATSLLLTVLVLPTVHGQTAAAVIKPLPPTNPSSPASPSAAGVATVPAKPAPVSARAGLPEIADQVEVYIKDATRSANESVRSTLRAAQTALWDADSPAFQFGSGARSSSRSLSVLTTSSDSDRIDDIEDDLSVMARILQKAARGLRDDERYNAMGIDLDASVFGSASGARNLYLEGHGALFLLSVKYPLVGPADAHASPMAPARPDTEWERTKDEVFGPNSGHNESESVTVLRGGRSKVEPFDETKVAGLKTALIDALTNATNIRHLAPNEFVTVVVQGGDVTDVAVKVYATTNSNINGRSEVKVRKEAKLSSDSGRKSALTSHGESMLTLRVKKSDLDALAAGRLTADQFRQNASVMAALRRTEPSRPSRK